MSTSRREFFFKGPKGAGCQAHNTQRGMAVLVTTKDGRRFCVGFDAPGGKTPEPPAPDEP